MRGAARRASSRGKDSLGNTEVIRQGHVQRMTAGTGITHSEFNASDSEPVHLLQIWITPNLQNLTPSYEDKFFEDEQKLNQWCLLASEKGEQNSLIVHQDIALYASKLSEQNQLEYVLKHNRSGYLQVASGTLEISVKKDGEINTQRLNAGDAALFDSAQTIAIKAIDNAEILLFDLPAQIILGD